MLLKQPTKSFCILKGSQRLHFLNADRKSLLLTFVYGAVSMYTMTFPVVEFSRQGYKIRKVLAKNQHTQRKLLNFENWVMGKCQKLDINLVSKVI